MTVYIVFYEGETALDCEVKRVYANRNQAKKYIMMQGYFESYDGSFVDVDGALGNMYILEREVC